jgi:hypothetical protein
LSDHEQCFTLSFSISDYGLFFSVIVALHMPAFSLIGLLFFARDTTVFRVAYKGRLPLVRQGRQAAGGRR